jgi:hypothetical protein
MKFLFLSLLFIMSLTSFAAEVSFTHFGQEGNRQSYYACSYVEDQTFDFLETLGATGIEVRCSGGITPGWYAGPVYVTARFDLPQVSGSEERILELTGDVFNPACGINVKIIKEVLKAFSHITVLKKQDQCPFADSNYYFQLKVLR